MLNIKIQCCGLVLIGLEAFFYARFQKLEVKTKRIFERLLYVSLLCVTTDIISVVAIYYADCFPQILVNAACKIYLIFLCMLMFSGFTYLCADIFKDEKTFRNIMIRSGACFVLAVISMLLLPIYYVCRDNGNTVYSYGASTTVTYMIFGIIFIAMVVLVYRGRHIMQPRRRLAVSIWLLMWLVAAMMQMIVSSLLIVSFAGCIGVLIIFFMIENPELSLDRTSGFFHVSAMSQYVTEVFGNDRKFFLINTPFRIEHTAFYEDIEHGVIFVGGGEIYLFFEERSGYEAALKDISERLEKQNIYYCEDRIESSFEEFLHTFKEVQQFVQKDRAATLFSIDKEAKKRWKERNEIRQMIWEALDKNQVEAFFQPIYSIHKGKFVSAEALARIRTEDGEIVAPGKFIPVAEEDGSIIQLGKRMFEQVCLFLNEMGTDQQGLQYIEINLSVVQGEDKHLAEDFLSVIHQYGIGTDRINLEITESASVTGREILLNNMKTLIDQGITFSLDDFGTGRSNLDYMSIMPVKIVKFDYSMTQSYFVSEKTRCVMNAAVHMIHEMGMKIVVEGIETEEQFHTMKELGVDYIQGYYFSRPLAKDDFMTYLKENNNVPG